MAVEEEHVEPAPDAAPPRFDWRVAGEGALWTLAIALPPVWLVLLFKSDDLPGEESNLWLVTPIALLIGFGVGGLVAAHRRPRTPFVHAAAAGAIAYGTVMAFSLVRRVMNGGDEVTLSYVVRLLVLAQICISSAVLGGYVAVRRTTRR